MNYDELMSIQRIWDKLIAEIRKSMRELDIEDYAANIGDTSAAFYMDGIAFFLSFRKDQIILDYREKKQFPFRDREPAETVDEIFTREFGKKIEITFYLGDPKVFKQIAETIASAMKG
jgi:TPP-dependent pyruvate/acetoin dehydrogenase alpha subunit